MIIQASKYTRQINYRSIPDTMDLYFNTNAIQTFVVDYPALYMHIDFVGTGQNTVRSYYVTTNLEDLYKRPIAQEQKFIFDCNAAMVLQFENEDFLKSFIEAIQGVE